MNENDSDPDLTDEEKDALDYIERKHKALLVWGPVKFMSPSERTDLDVQFHEMYVQLYNGYNSKLKKTTKKVTAYHMFQLGWELDRIKQHLKVSDAWVEKVLKNIYKNGYYGLGDYRHSNGKAATHNLQEMAKEAASLLRDAPGIKWTGPRIRSFFKEKKSQDVSDSTARLILRQAREIINRND